MKLNPHTSPSVINLPLRTLLTGALGLLAALLTLFAMPSASAAPVTLTYNTPGTNYWVCPFGVTSIQVECWGGGGAGGAGRKDTATGSNTSQNGGGGGGGAYARRASVPVTPGQSYAITIPPAAVSGANGTTVNGQGRVNGGTVTFTGDGAVSVTAAGGQGGANAYTTANSTTGAGGGAGGATAACVGDVGGLFAGGLGWAGLTGSTNTSGGGGGGAGNANPGGNAYTNQPGLGGVAGGGNGGGGAVASGNTGASAGFAGTTPGGGGGGGHNQGINTRLGGTGGLGQIVITYDPNVKANNTDNLNLASSWTESVPAATALAVWNATVLEANTTALGADLTFGGISILNPGGMVTINGPNTLTLGAAATDINMSVATVDLTLNCPLVLGADNVWNVTTSRTLTLGNTVSGSFPVTKQGAGTAIFSVANSYTGATTISLGTLKLGAADVIPDGSGNGNVAVNGTLDLNTFSETINGLSGVGIVDTVAGGNPTLTVGGDNQSSTFSGIIINTSGTLNLVKTGSGTLILTGANSYSGNTTISNGMLRLNGSSSSATSVKNGGSLGGTGAINASVTVENGGVVTAGDGAFRTLTVSNLTFNSGAVLNIGTLFSYDTVAAVKVVNALTINGGAGAVTINLPTPPQANGVHHLLRFGSGTVTTNLFTLGTVPTLTPHQTGASLQVNGNYLDYVITGYDDIWTGVEGTEWSTTTQVINWMVNGNLDFFYNGDSVEFSDVGATRTVDISVADVTPGRVRFTNTLGNDYTLQGSFAIAGGTGLAKEGGGTLTINNSNTFTGGVNIKAGTLVLGNGAALGSTNANTVIAAGATLDLAGITGAQNNPVVVSGGGTTGTNAITSSLPIASPFIGLRFVTLSNDTVLNADTRWDIGNNTTGGSLIGNGYKLTVCGTNDMSLNILGNTDLGDVVVSNRVLYIQGNTSLGRTSNTVFVNPGSSLNLWGNAVFVDKPLALDGGTLANGSGSATYSGPISVNANSAVSASTFTISGAISGAGGLNFTNGNTVLTASNSFSGGTTLTGGTLTASNSFALGTGDVIFNGGIRLVVGGAVTITNPITLGPNAGTTGNGLVMASAGTGMITGPITITNGAAAGGHFATPAGSALVVAGPITASVNVTHRNGTVVFSGGGSGYTTLLNNQGTTTVGASNGIATSASVIIGASGAGTLDLNGFSQSLVGVTKSGTSAATITNSSTTSDSTLTLTGTSTFAGVITDSGTTKINLTVDGGVFTLTGTNTYRGATTIRAGTLVLSNDLAINLSSGLTIAAGATLNTVALTVPPPASIPLTASGTGTAVGTTAAAIIGVSGQPLDLGSRQITLNFDGTNPALYLSGGTLNLNNNPFTINGPLLANGVYMIIEQSDAPAITGSLASSTVNGTALTGKTGTVSLAGNMVLLSVSGGSLPQPTIAPVSVSGTNLVLSLPSISGYNYVLQSATNLTPAINWQNESTNAGNGGNLILNVPIDPAKPQKFLRFWAY